MSGSNREPVTEHERYMERALELAERGRRSVAPNPMVGCVIVRDDEIVGEGWHERAGEAHAEVRALEAAGEAARGATVYVTLEPCSHHGRTPPCAEALLRAGVKRVVIAAPDPDPRVDGRGIRLLVDSGVEVVTEVLREEADALNEAFLRVQRERRPFVLYKTAMTLDGKIATRSGQSRWITGEGAREQVHRWRHLLDGVVVGVNTVLLDDPLLTARVEGSRTPTKVVFDSVARTPVNARLFEGDREGRAPRVVVIATAKAPPSRVEALRRRGAEVLVVAERRGRCDVGEALRALRERGVHSLLLEGGGTLAWSFFEAGAIDRVAWFIAPKLLGGGGATPLGGLGVGRMDEAIELAELHTEFVGRDLLISGQVRCRTVAEQGAKGQEN